MSSSSFSSSSVARGSSYRSYSRSSSTRSVNSIENLPPRTIARVGREVSDLIKSPPDGIDLVVDQETGLPSSLGEIVVSLFSFCLTFENGSILLWFVKDDRSINTHDIISHAYSTARGITRNSSSCRAWLK